jgi:hypothetical protein
MLGALLCDADVFVLENYRALGQHSLRLASEQIIAATSELDLALPRRLMPATRDSSDSIAAPMAAIDRYPTGGFATLTTSGSLENLLTSELMYMDDRRSRDGLDLFDIRYAEGELLYYTRDESMYERTRREISFWLMPDLAALRFKDPTLRWQRLVIALAAVVVCARRLRSWLGDQHLRLRIVFFTGDSDPLAAERSLLELCLRDQIASDIALVGTARELTRERDANAMRAATADTSVIVLSAVETPMRIIDGVRTGGLHLGDPWPRLWWAHRAQLSGADAAPVHGLVTASDSAGSTLWRAWVDVTTSVLQGLI